ncbi:mitochondrial fission process protein 1 [Elysia marginata]|uniref:Mitochondrial fission process protein 1 n=1 Tax=Elysia marginata TaxID=1093978 RepID=A0AAV4JHQ2_9GAST|nr:mitochondrial fission process protein 1 [Elysia marginata]
MQLQDPFRVVPVRHLGHGFAIAAAFGPTIYLDTHDLLNTISTGYIIVHAVHRGMAVGGNSLGKVFFDTLIFDCLASALLPTFVTYHVRLFVRSIVSDTRVRCGIFRWMPVVFSLASLAFTWVHIDQLVDRVLDQTIRTL